MSSHCDRVYAVSGAASGIGFATARWLYRQGARLSLTDIDHKLLEDAASTILDGKESSGRILTTVADVSSSEAVDEWINKTAAHFGALHGAANVAGVVGKSVGVHSLAELTDEEWAFVMDTNSSGVFYALRAQVRAMKKLGTKGTSIVNVSSIAGLEGNARSGAYSASKHAVIGLTRTAAKEFGGLGIRVNAIAP